jgi:AraC family ethanolamine operon transcriptional activator
MSQTDEKHSREWPETGIVPFQDIRQFADSFSGIWDFEYKQLGLADEHGFCRYAKDDTGLVYDERFAASIGLRGNLAEGLFSVHLTDACGCSGRWQGEHAPPNAFAYADSRTEIDVLIPRGTRNVCVVLPLEQAIERVERLGNAPLLRMLPGDHLFRTLDPTSRRGLVSELQALVREPPTAGGIGMAAVESLVRALDGAQDHAGPPTRAARLLFRRAMERCRDDDLMVSPAQLALDLRVSLRSLEMAFRSCMGMPPARYLRILRLNRAYERLLAVDPDEGFVGNVALDLGFTQFGRFSAEFRKLFGELPSATLQRRPPPRRVRLPRLK